MIKAIARPLWMCCLTCCAIALLPQGSNAQTYPAKPVRLLIPYPPGGASDFVGRTIAAKLAEQMREQVVIENRGGGGGSIAIEIAAKGTPDGHTLGFAMTAQFAINPALYPKLPYDPVRDFAPVSLMTRSPYLLVVHPSVAAKSLTDLVPLAKARPGELNHWSTGNGSAPHLSMEMLKSGTGVSMVHVPYEGAGLAWPDFLSGRVHMTFATFSSTAPHIRAGRLRPLGVSSPSRMKVFPELPTIAEQGVPGYESGTWLGLAKAQIAYWENVLTRVAQTEEWKQMIEKIRADPEFLDSARTRAQIRTDVEELRAVMSELGLK